MVINSPDAKLTTNARLVFLHIYYVCVCVSWNDLAWRMITPIPFLRLSRLERTLGRRLDYPSSHPTFYSWFGAYMKWIYQKPAWSRQKSTVRHYCISLAIRAIWKSNGWNRKRDIDWWSFLHLNEFHFRSGQFQISLVASPEIWHHTVWRTWLFIVYSDERWLYYQFSQPHLYISIQKVGRMYFFELGNAYQYKNRHKIHPVKLKEKVLLEYRILVGFRNMKASAHCPTQDASSEILKGPTSNC